MCRKDRFHMFFNSVKINKRSCVYQRSWSLNFWVQNSLACFNEETQLPRQGVSWTREYSSVLLWVVNITSQEAEESHILPWGRVNPTLWSCHWECMFCNQKRVNPWLDIVIQCVSFPHPGMIPLSKIRCMTQQFHFWVLYPKEESQSLEKMFAHSCP